MVVPRDQALHALALCSTVKAMRYLQLGCSGYLAYMSDTRIGGTTMLSEVPIFRDFHDVFPEELPGLPPERKVEF